MMLLTLSLRPNMRFTIAYVVCISISGGVSREGSATDEATPSSTSQGDLETLLLKSRLVHFKEYIQP